MFDSQRAISQKLATSRYSVHVSFKKNKKTCCNTGHVMDKGIYFHCKGKEAVKKGQGMPNYTRTGIKNMGIGSYGVINPHLIFWVPTVCRDSVSIEVQQ